MICQKVQTQEHILKKQQVYEAKSKEILEKVLGFSGLQLSQDIDYRSVKIYQIDHMHEIYTMNQNENLPHMVLLHGFGGTAMTYFRLFKYLRPYYRVHALDTMGVGHSSKGVFKNNFDYDQTKHYFIDAIQKWRAAMNIESFTLVGHSFGGYLAACYTQTYPGRVNRLIMLSPAGVTQKTPQQIEKQLKERTQNKSFKTKLFYYVAQKAYNWRFRPAKIMGNYFVGDKFINKVVDQRLNLVDQESRVWKLYFKDLSKKQAVGETGFYILFQFPLKTKHTIQTIVKRMNFHRPIEFYYGSHDWMDNKGAVRLAYTTKNVHFDKISSAGHQLLFDNPYQICQKIIQRRTTQEIQNSKIKYN